MHSKKLYWFGIGLLIFVCLLMHLFAKSLENLRMLHHVLEAFGYYTGYLDTPLTRWLWPVLVIVVLVLLLLAISMITKALEPGVKKDYKIIPFCILITGIISCLTFPSTFGLFLRVPSGLNAVMLSERHDFPLVFSDSDETSIALGFYKLSPGDAEFQVKFIDLNDSTNETTLDFTFNIDKRIRSLRRGIGLLDSWYYTGAPTRLHFFSVENLPGYDPELDNWCDLRFKIVIFNEHESKTFYPYFERYNY